MNITWIRTSKDKLTFMLLILLIACAITFTFKQEILGTILFYQYKFMYWVKGNERKMLLLWGHGIGEHEHMERIRIAATRKGINFLAVSDQTPTYFYDKFVNNRSEIAAHAFNPDLILILEKFIAPIPGYKNYLWLDESSDHYVNNDYIKYLNYDGLLPLFKDTENLPKTSRILFNWYPTSYVTEYEAQIPQKIFYPGGVLYEAVRGGDKYKQVFSMLDKTGYLEVYGFAGNWAHTPNSFKGKLPFDGVSILEVANQKGISLVLHGKDHLLHGLPTGRIFEAAAANTVIISDMNKFVLDNFGDNVLYLDVTKSADEIYAQIDAHMQWIFANTKEAMQMADRCHTIVNERFTFENQLERLFGSDTHEIDRTITG